MLSSTLLVLLAGLAAFLVAAGVTPLVRRYALGRMLVSGGREDRWNPQVIPSLGGVGIFFAFALASLVGTALLDGPGQLLRAFTTGLLAWDAGTAIVAAALIMFLTGLWDDHVTLPPAGKLLPQIAAGAILISAGVMLRLTGLYPVDMALSMLWFVGITNALNLLDNMDGLAAGIAGLAALTLAAIFLSGGRPDLALLAVALAGAAGGFLVHNYPPAKIFMGDSGALFLGVVLSGLALSPTPGGGRGIIAVLVVPVLLLAIPILDTTLVTAVRVMEGRSVAQGGRDHTSHRLVALGVSERRTVHLLWLLAAMGGGVAYLLQGAGRPAALLVGGGFVTLLLLLGGRLLQVPLPSELPVAGNDPEAQFRRTLLWNRARPVVLILLDLVLVVTAYYTAYLLRWSPEELIVELEYFQRSLPLVLGAKLLGFGLAGLYDRTGLPDDVGRLFRASAVGSLAAIAVLVMVAGLGLSRGVLILDFVLCTLLVGAVRLAPGFGSSR